MTTLGLLVRVGLHDERLPSTGLTARVLRLADLPVGALPRVREEQAIGRSAGPQARCGR